MRFRQTLLLTFASFSLPLAIFGCNSQSDQALAKKVEHQKPLQTQKPVSSIGLSKGISLLMEAGESAEVRISVYYPEYFAGSSGRFAIQEIDGVSVSKTEENFRANEDGKTDLVFEVTMAKSGKFNLPVEAYLTDKDSGLTQGALEKIQILDKASANIGSDQIEKTNTGEEAPRYPKIIEMPSKS